MDQRPSKMHFNQRKTTPLSFSRQQWGPNCHNQPPSKVVLTPAHSVGSERNITDSATKIQRVARGFLVRKSVKKMMKMKMELEEIKKKVNDEETVKMIKEVQMERLKMDESLATLLLRLDSVRVFGCSALRGVRRSLVKRAIFLQEFVDQIQMVEKKNKDDGDDGKCARVRAATKIQMVARGYLVRKDMKKMLKIKMELDEIEKKVNNKETVKIMKEKQEERISMNGAIMDLLLRLDSVIVFPCSPLREFRKSLINKAIFLDEFVDQVQTVDLADEHKEVTKVWIDSEILTRMMMDENLEMVRRIKDDSKKQTSVLTSLTQRVEQLERAFSCDKNRRYVCKT
ncbi:uncharacterized protein LOC131629229 [Vicia villosa]|uniref:uncharacterized protein LOC131629229 n=1 Tax=Vicia villosa TaxID=3911 RepID=UPI00273C53AA|nr:uncharacterized protein LOC131629229 [Vicia villosa]